MTQVIAMMISFVSGARNLTNNLFFHFVNASDPPKVRIFGLMLLRKEML